MSEAELAFAATLAVPPERVFAAVTEGRHVQRWLCDACESEPRVNGRLRLLWNRPGSTREPFEARWVEFAPPARAAFQGGHPGYPNGNAGTVWYEVQPEDGATVLRVRHELPSRAGYEALIAPWKEAWPRALSRLERYLGPPASAGR